MFLKLWMICPHSLLPCEKVTVYSIDCLLWFPVSPRYAMTSEKFNKLVRKSAALEAVGVAGAIAIAAAAAAATG
jgi:hypothetical protein